MNINPSTRRIILVITVLLIIVLAWKSIDGGFSQFSQSLTIGQKLETIVQIICGLLSLLNVVTCLYLKGIRRPIRIGWAISLTMTAGLSSIVWGPPMLITGVVVTVIALLVALAINKLLQIGGA